MRENAPPQEMSGEAVVPTGMFFKDYGLLVTDSLTVTIS